MHNPTDDLPSAAPKSGIDAPALVIPGEDACQLAALAADYHRELRPAGPLQRFLVDSLIYADWQLRRLRRGFHYMQRRIDSTERSYSRALQQLQRIQPSRSASAPAPGPRPPAEPRRREPLNLADLPDTRVQ